MRRCGVDSGPSLPDRPSEQEQVGTLQARFSPDSESWDTGFPFEPQDRDEDLGSWPHYALRCLTVRRTGPVVEIYRLDPERSGL